VIAFQLFRKRTKEKGAPAVLWGSNSTIAAYLITGSSRVLGLALVRQLVAMQDSQVSTVFATARSENCAALRGLVRQHNDRVVFTQLDTTSQPSISNAMTKLEEHLRDQGLDVLISNAVIQTICLAGMQAVEDPNEIFNANVTSVHMVGSAFLPLLKGCTRRSLIFQSSSQLQASFIPRQER
jgi:NAD(P)-dependent dehydrogenase (short-subunit alcohol dehydrogenase family)